jgi:hypothetical protein
MTSCIAQVAIDASDVEVVARFWRDVLGWQELERDEGIISIGPPDGSGPGIDVIRVPEPKSVKNRLHLDLRADGSSTEQELERLLALGARRADVGQAPGRQLDGADRSRGQRVLPARHACGFDRLTGWSVGRWLVEAE